MKYNYQNSAFLMLLILKFYLLEAKLDFRTKFFYVHRGEDWLYQKPTKWKEYNVYIGIIKISCLPILSLESYSPLSTNDLSWSFKKTSPWGGWFNPNNHCWWAGGGGGGWISYGATHCHWLLLNFYVIPHDQLPSADYGRQGTICTLLTTNKIVLFKVYPETFVFPLL